ncbi:MAG: hypothetical protein NT084_10665 [Bacteroidetes bacterium]|nr:hypothetical protein [Bacteroidota bacterium]
MSTSNQPIFKLRIGSGSEYKFVIRVIVFDARNNQVHSSSVAEIIECSLKKGLYTVRVQLNGKINDTIISLSQDTNLVLRIPPYGKEWENARIIDLPKQYSSALFKDTYHESYESTHEYYTGPAVNFSQTSTSTSYKNDRCTLFIFLRFPTRELFHTLESKWEKTFNKYFQLLREDGTLLFDFSDTNNVKINLDDGWMAFNVVLNSGLYFLNYVGKDPRQVPIYIYENWHTQLFLTIGATPLFGTLRIFLSNERRFNPDDTNNKYIDIFLDKIQNKSLELEDELIQFSANNKFESPMLALLCAYIYLRGANTKHDYLIGMMLYNLNNLILKNSAASPDLRALEILASKHFSDKRFSKKPILGTPMFRLGFEVIRKASVDSPKLIKKYSLNDYLSEYLYYDSPYTTFKPVPKMVGEFNVKSQGKFKSLKGDSTNPFRLIFNITERVKKSKGENALIEKLPVDLDKTLQMSQDFKISYILPKSTEIPVANLLGENVFNKFIHQSNEEDENNSWLTFDMADMLKQNQNLSVSDLSKQLNVSGTTINRIFSDYKKLKK